MTLGDERLEMKKLRISKWSFSMFQPVSFWDSAAKMKNVKEEEIHLEKNTL